MTKEELRKEAEELFKKKPLGYKMKPELEIYTDGFNDGYNKANEWHYVKDGEDLPKDNSEYLLLLEHGIRVFGYYNGKWWESWKGDLSWQEVKAYFFVPVPELKESE